jgi:hypothetical protein
MMAGQRLYVEVSLLAEMNKELAKLYLEQRGLLTSLDVQMEEEGPDAPGFDVVGVEILNGAVVRAVMGVVHGWWNAGFYLTPSLIHSHLETDRRLLSEAFSDERVGYIRSKFGLGNVPIEKLLFYSQKSPSRSDQAEKMLKLMSIDVVYLENIIVETLPKVGNTALGEGVVSQLLPVIRFSRVFRDMHQELQKAQKGDLPQEPEESKFARALRIKTQKQMDFMKMFTSTGIEDADSQEKLETVD